MLETLRGGREGEAMSEAEAMEMVFQLQERNRELARDLAAAHEGVALAETLVINHEGHIELLERDLAAGQARIVALTEALQSIAKNTCCEGCQEAALVARAALTAPDSAVDEKRKIPC